jgi:hypothetical protein
MLDAHRRCGSDQVAYRERQKRSRDVESKDPRPLDGPYERRSRTPPDARPSDAGIQIAAQPVVGVEGGSTTAVLPRCRWMIVININDC